MALALSAGVVLAVGAAVRFGFTGRGSVDPGGVRVAALPLSAVALGSALSWS